MFADWRHAYANIALTGGNLFFLLIVVKSPTPTGIILATGLVGITSFYGWYANLRRLRATADTPTSRVFSAPQGYIELAGRGVNHDGEHLRSPISGLPCLWYRYLIEEKSGNKWCRIDSGASDEIFGLQDGTGLMLIDPDGAEIITSNKQVSIKGNYRYTEWTLNKGESLYVLGEHVTLDGAAAYLNWRQDVSDLISEWKQDKASLVKRFDFDGDENISLEEWESARDAAIKQVEQTHRETRPQNGTSMVRKSNGRPYLIANRSPQQMVSRYSRWAWVHLCLLFAACLLIVVML